MPRMRPFPDLWLRPCDNSPERLLGRLVCMPYAAGTAHAYRSWSEYLPPEIAVFGVQYPGRQDRFGEPLVQDLHWMVGEIVDAMEAFVGEPLSILGHSMGAYVAYEVAAELERRHGPVVDALVVSGAPAPHLKGRGTVHELPDAELIAEVERVNPSFAELLAKPDLVELLLPMIRADYRLFEVYERVDPVPLRAVLVAAGGTSDPEVGRAELEAWSDFADGHFDVFMLPGGHFYLVDDEDAMVRALAAYLPGAQRRPAGG